MLPRARRLHAERDWDTLFRQGFSVSGPLLALRVSPPAAERRVGFSVGRKVGGAVVRNRVKRRLRALVQTHWERFPRADVAVMARPAAAQADFPTLQHALLELAGRAAKRGRPPAGTGSGR